MTAIHRALAFAATLILFTTSPCAQLFRAYVASDGSDTNPCTLQQPCRLLPAALSAVASGGEIWMLDSANYNTSPVTIGKSVSILAVPGAVGSVVATGGAALTVSASGLMIALRNLVIVPQVGAGGTYGIYMTGASTIDIEGCLFANLTSFAVQAAGTGKVRIAHSTFRNLSVGAVRLASGATADISSTRFTDAYIGLMVESYSTQDTAARVSDSIFGSGGTGIDTYSAVSGGVSRVVVTRSTFQGLDTALQCTSGESGATAVISISYSMVAGNDVPWILFGADAIIRSLVNNHVTNNTGTSVGSLTTVAPQ
jgi:hypothetical protein